MDVNFDKWHFDLMFGLKPIFDLIIWLEWAKAQSYSTNPIYKLHCNLLNEWAKAQSYSNNPIHKFIFRNGLKPNLFNQSYSTNHNSFPPFLNGK
jgi:hypothetical protein